MTQKSLNPEWKTDLLSILEELTVPQFEKMKFLLDKIPRSLRSDKSQTPVELTQIILDYYKKGRSITAIKRIMKNIPKWDPVVQNLLRPHVEKLKQKQQENEQLPQQERGRKRKHDSEEKENRPAADPKKSCPAPTKEGNIRPWMISILDVKSSRHIPNTKAIAGKVIQKSGLRSYKTKDNVKNVFFYVAVADGTASIKLMIYGKAHYKTIEEEKFYTFRKLIKDDMAVRVTKRSTVSKTSSVEVPEELEKEAGKLIYPECPLYSVAKAKSCDDKTEVNVEGTVTEIDPVESVTVQRQEEKTKTKRQHFSIQDESGSIRICMWDEGTKLCKGLTVGDIIKLTNVKTHHYYDDVSLNSTSSTRILKIQSAGIQNKRIEIIGIIKDTKKETKLEAEYKEEVQTFVVPSQLLAKTFEIQLDDDFVDSLLDKMPLFADVEIQGNEIIKMTDVQKTSK